MKKITFYLLIILFLSYTTVSAKTIVMTFSATGFSPGINGTPSAPEDPVSGTISWEADSVNSPIISLTSIDLVIDGYSYTLEDISFDNSFPVIGGNLNGADWVYSGAGDDFGITWDNTNLEPGVLVYATNNYIDIFPNLEFSDFRIEEIPDPDSKLEREALIAFYHSTDGPNWTNNSNWLGVPGTECDWFGITCYAGEIKSIYLYENNLTGIIPPEIGNLASLETLSLYENNLTGGIPAEIGNLSNLKNINLSRNNISGSIPPDIGKLSRLEVLAINDNQLSGSIPTAIGNLANLVYIYLLNNHITGNIPPEIANMANLESLYLTGNELTGEIPAEIGSMVNLKYLSLGWNKLTGEIPPEIGDMVNLRGLYLGANQLSGEIPAEIGNLTNLYYLYLHLNQLTGRIPPEMGNLVNIGVLYLSDNPLYGLIPLEFGYLLKLKVLGVSSTCITGGFDVVGFVPTLEGEPDADPDNDEIGNFCDICPLDPENDLDGDAICGNEDNCPYTYNLDQSDTDRDGIGNECDACLFDPDNDLDSDGICGDSDQCNSTPSGVVINEDGCSIQDICECDADWQNQRRYLDCIAKTSKDFISSGLITKDDRKFIQREAEDSLCGVKK